MKAEDKNSVKEKPKRTLLTKLGTITSSEGDKKITFRYVSPSELKRIRRTTYDYLIK
jgi:hypothetical protein